MTSQTYNDGFLKIYEMSTVNLPGMAPKVERRLKYQLRYEERSIGITRAYLAMQSGNRVDLVLRCPRVPVSTLDIAVPNDGLDYRIDINQHPADVVPESMDLQLRRKDPHESYLADT